RQDLRRYNSLEWRYAAALAPLSARDSHSRLWHHSIFFFLYPYRPRGDLHSFPTRRSSDLSWWSAAPWSVWCRWRAKPAISTACRSEEHTSELQSRENLVCRLLLEKKNQRLTDMGSLQHLLRDARSRADFVTAESI